MYRVTDSWFSDRIGKEMPVVRYGETGHPFLFFPTAAADYLEYERFKLIEGIAPLIDEGHICVFSIDSINRDAWLNDDIETAEKAARQVAYDAYITKEVVPYIESACQTPGIGITTVGASFGAYHALNTLLKHPDQFSGTIAMSGCFDIRQSCDGYHDENVYFNNPIEYIPNLEDEALLEKLRSRNITIVSGQGDYEKPEYSQEMHEILQAKNLGSHLELWGADVAHDWPWWVRMLNHMIPSHCQN